MKGVQEDGEHQPETRHGALRSSPRCNNNTCSLLGVGCGETGGSRRHLSLQAKESIGRVIDTMTGRQRRSSTAEAPRRVQAPAPETETKESESPQGRSKVCSYTL